MECIVRIFMAEIIDFFWPNEIGKSIYVTNIKDDLNDEDTLKVSHDIRFFQLLSESFKQ